MGSALRKSQRGARTRQVHPEWSKQLELGRREVAPSPCSAPAGAQRQAEKLPWEIWHPACWEGRKGSARLARRIREPRGAPGLSSGAGSASAVPAARGTAQPWGSETAPHAGLLRRAERCESGSTPGRSRHLPSAKQGKSSPQCLVFLRAARAEGADVALGRQGRRARRGMGAGSIHQGAWAQQSSPGLQEGGRCLRDTPGAWHSLQPVLGAAGLSQTSHCHLPAATTPLLPRVRPCLFQRGEPSLGAASLKALTT